MAICALIHRLFITRRCQKQQSSAWEASMLDAELFYGSLSLILCNCMIARFFWVRASLRHIFSSLFSLIAALR
jgi:hypothetical protein